MKEEFIKFLKKVNAYDKFLTALAGENRTFDQKIVNSMPNSYIISAFTWMHTEDRSDYWNDLHERWVQIVKRYGEKNK